MKARTGFYQPKGRMNNTAIWKTLISHPFPSFLPCLQILTDFDLPEDFPFYGDSEGQSDFLVTERRW